MIHEERMHRLNQNRLTSGDYVVYWMQASQRVQFNHALEYAILKANRLHQPVIVFFGLTDNYPEANERHYYFMLEGLKELDSSLAQRNIKLLIQHVSPEKGISKLAQKASLVIVDRGYLRHQRLWRKFVAEKISCPVIQIESDIVVPVEAASTKEEYSAATLRKKIKKHLKKFYVSLTEHHPDKSSLSLELPTLSTENIKKSIANLKIDRTVKKSQYYKGGASVGMKRMKLFLDKKIDRFEELRNEPSLDYCSSLSPYLHFGQISPLHIALDALQTESPGLPSFLEELIVRRELAINYVFYNDSHYDTIEGLPKWAYASLNDHKNDKREYTYTLEELEQAKTHDSLWNTAQKEMIATGKMQGYMRMYWGKKMIEWTTNPSEAFRYALYLNNKYELDGRDPNGYAGIAWCFGKHDRAWKERPIFGKIRYMNAQGLTRKFDMMAYQNKIKKLL